MKRFDWLDRLWETIEARRTFPFRWGASVDAHDCCTFVAACIKAMTGRDLVPALLTEYSDEATAIAYIARAGGLEAAITSHLGQPKKLSFMSRGDVVLVENGGIQFAGVCLGNSIVSAGPDGLGSNPASLALVAWGL